MAKELKAGDEKLLQYLNEAYSKEKELEVSLEAHIAMTTKAPYKKRLQEHLKETKAHARGLERRIKKISGGGPAALEKVVAQAAGQAKSMMKGPLQMLRGTGEAEKMLKNARTEYWNEHEEIATYTAIEVLATELGDSETAKLAEGIRREEERMAGFLERQIPSLTKAVAREEVPAAERCKPSRRTSRRPTSKSSASASKARASKRKRPTSKPAARSGSGSSKRAASRAKSPSRAKSSSGRSRAGGAKKS